MYIITLSTIQNINTIFDTCKLCTKYNGKNYNIELIIQRIKFYHFDAILTFEFNHIMILKYIMHVQYMIIL